MSLVTRLLTLAAVAALAGCGGDSGGSTIALLLPNGKGVRYESAGRVQFERKVHKICAECEILYREAGEDTSTQEKQADAVLERGIDVLVLDAVIPEYATKIVKRAKEAEVPVLSYDTLAAFAEPDAFVSYSGVETGELQAKALVQRMREQGHPRGPVVMGAGEPANRDQHYFEEGAKTTLAARGVTIADHFYTPFWDPKRAREKMRRAIETLGRNGFAGVYAETNGIARGAIEAMEAAGIDPGEKPVTGREATVKGLRQVLSGRQYMTTYMPVEPKAVRAAEVAVTLAAHEELRPAAVTDELENGKFRVPSILLKPVKVTRANIAGTVVADGFVSAAELCAAPLAKACREAGIR